MTTTANSYKQIVWSYIKNKSFLFLSLLLAASWILLKNFMPAAETDACGSHRDSVWQILWNIFMFGGPFIFGMWWPLLFGTIIKAQFAHPRASLLPMFRIRHLAVAFGVLAVFEILLWDCLFRLMVIAHISQHFALALFFLIVWTLASIWLGYLFSSGSYIVFSFVGFGIMQASKMVTSSMGTSIPGGPAAMPVYLFGAGYLVWMLGRRLWNLKEEHWEYRWSLTLADMRSQRYGYGQWARNDGRQSQSTWMERWFYTKLKFKPYPAQGSLWARSWHRMLGTYFGASWKYMTLVTVGLGAWIIFSISPEYWQRALDRGAWQYSMYVLFGMVGLQYTLMTTEQFLKPVRRDRVVAELLMANALLSLMMYFEFMLAMWIVPIAVRAPELLASGKMWLSVLASFSFAVFLIGVGSILIRFLQGPRSYWLIYLVFLMPAIVGSSALEEHMPLGLGGLTAIFFALGAILWWVAYRLWCQVEFGRLGRMGGVW